MRAPEVWMPVTCKTLELNLRCNCTGKGDLRKGLGNEIYSVLQETFDAVICKVGLELWRRSAVAICWPKIHQTLCSIPSTPSPHTFCFAIIQIKGLCQMLEALYWTSQPAKL